MKTKQKREITKTELAPDKLENFYWNQNKTTREIAALIGVSKSTVLYWMRKYNIKRRTRSQCRKGMHFSPATEFKKGYSNWEKRGWKPIDRTILEQMYWGENKTLSEIAHILNVGPHKVFYWMKKHHIKRRTRSRATALSCKQGKTYPPRHHAFRKPTVPELALAKIINKYNLPYKYVGNGEVWFENYNPDFINMDGLKGIIEVFGTYWHRDLANPKLSEWGRGYHYAKYGYKTLVLWENELDNEKRVVTKIRRFNKGLLQHVTKSKEKEE